MARWGIEYDKKALIKDLALFGLMVIAMKLTGGAGFGVMFIVAFAALSANNHERLLLMLLMTAGVVVGNSTLMPKNFIFGIEQKVLMVVLASALMFRSNGKHQSPLVTPFLGFMPYMAWTTFTSCQGWNPLVSYLKIFLFLAGYFAIYGIANTVILGERIPIVRVRSVFLSLCCFTLLGSVALIPFPGMSQMSGDAYLEAMKEGKALTSLFCGMTFHSQTLGPLAAMLFVAVFSDFILSIRKKDWLYIILMLAAPLCLYKTSSRTALGTMLVGTFFTLWCFMKTRQVESKWKARVTSTVLMISIVGSMLLAVTPAGRDAFARYVLKYGGEDVKMKDVSMEDVVLTRQGLMDEAMYNFRKKPLLGNGFQVNEKMAGGRGFSILTAPVEKGVWVTAVLEESGVPGMILFVLFGITAIPLLVKRKAYTGATILFTIFVVNLGEFTMFSMSGIGAYYWALAFMGCVMDAQRLREHKIVTWYATEEQIARDPDLNPYA